MHRRTFMKAAAAGSASLSGSLAAASPSRQNTRGIAPLAPARHILAESPDPASVYCYSPGLARLDTGRLIATMEFGGKGVRKMPGIALSPEGYPRNGRIYTSDDHGAAWTLRHTYPLTHARPFTAGNSLYILGHHGNLGILASEDGGESWSGVSWLTEDQHWHQAPCNVHYKAGRVYLVMERNTDPSFRGWPVAVLAPVVMNAPETANLLDRSAWTFSNELTYNEAAEEIGGINGLGVPFYSFGATAPGNPGDRRGMSPPGWLETHIVEFTDPDHLWHDPEGKTLYLWMRAHTGATNLACVAQAVTGGGGSIMVQPAEAPSGKKLLYMPCPGGHLKFHLLPDPVSGLFWLVSNQATDSMTRPERLPADRYNLPNNERHRLALYFSKNAVDWCFAGLVADTEHADQARNYPSMVIDDADLHILARSGDPGAKNAHDGNMITLHTVRNFRDLVY
jgi:hypothetical protein